jgi:Fe-S cluster assembly ATP-binding protein
MNRPVLTVEDLVVEAGGRRVLDGVGLEMRPGEVHALMGPNGSGKSTLAHALVGHRSAVVVAGRARLGDVDLLGLPAWRRARLGLGFVPQAPAEVPGVRLAEVLAAALGEDERAVGERLAGEAARLGLDEAVLRRGLNVDVSGGEHKRLELAALGLLRPRVAVVDEIDSGLDVDGLHLVGSRLSELAAAGTAVLAITHWRRLLAVVEPTAVHVLVGGRIVARGGPELASELERTGYRLYESVA